MDAALGPLCWKSPYLIYKKFCVWRNLNIALILQHCCISFPSYQQQKCQWFITSKMLNDLLLSCIHVQRNFNIHVQVKKIKINMCNNLFMIVLKLNGFLVIFTWYSSKCGRNPFLQTPTCTGIHWFGFQGNHNDYKLLECWHILIFHPNWWILSVNLIRHF